MQRFVPWVVVLGSIAATPSMLLAAPITIDITGTVFTYEWFDHSTTFVEQIGTLSSLDVVASITFDGSLGPAPTIDSFGSFNTYSQVSIGAPLDEFVSGSATWANGIFAPAPVPVPVGATAVGDARLIQNVVGGDDNFVVADRYAYQFEDTGDGFVVGLLFSFVDGFLPGDVVPTGSELPDFSSAIGQVVLQSVAFTGDNVYDGYQVGIDVTSVTVRPAPEPVTIQLLLAGLASLAGLVIVRRVRRPVA
jgi:hypothetical protein